MSDIVTLGDPVLQTVAAPVTSFDASLEALVATLFQSMQDGQGIGLAAPQIGVSLRVFVTGLEDDKPRVFVNPEIVLTSQEESEIEEGCLSVPGIYVVVRRPASIRMQAWTEKGKPFVIDAEGMLARVLQHEYDHLQGTVFLDRLPPGKRQRALILYNRRVRM
jgi:peptide deformylase